MPSSFSLITLKWRENVITESKQSKTIFKIFITQ